MLMIATVCSHQATHRLHSHKPWWVLATLAPCLSLAKILLHVHYCKLTVRRRCGFSLPASIAVCGQDAPHAWIDSRYSPLRNGNVFTPVWLSAAPAACRPSSTPIRPVSHWFCSRSTPVQDIVARGRRSRTSNQRPDNPSFNDSYRWVPRRPLLHWVTTEIGQRQGEHAAEIKVFR